MKYQQFLRELEQRRIAPAYLFEGEEDYLKEEALKKLKERIILPDYEDFNYEKLSAFNVPATQIVESVSTLPFKGKHRLVVVDAVDKWSEKDQRILASYLKNPVKSSCLVCLGGKFDRRRKLYQEFQKNGKIVSFYPLWDEEIVDWIQERIKKGGKEIKPEALFYLKERIGNDLQSLSQEIEKLIIFTHPARIIQKEDVEKVVGEGKGLGVFDLTHAVREKDLARALPILSQLLERGEAPLRIHSLIVHEIRRLLRIKQKEGRLSPQEACFIVFGPRNYYPQFYTNLANHYLQAAKRFSLSELITGYEDLVEAEASIKTGREEPEVVIQRMVVSLLVAR
ncbi:MAG: DNA polymerase III subunit delta [bacterium]